MSFWDRVFRRKPPHSHDTSNCPICSTSPTPEAMTDEQFAAFLSACRDEFTNAQTAFQRRINGGGQWFYDLADCTLRIGEQTFPISPIGTHNSEQQTWLWAWANEEFPIRAREASKRLQNLHALTGFKVFAISGIGASADDAQDFAALAIHYLGAIGLFRVPGVATLFLAVHEANE